MSALPIQTDALEADAPALQLGSPENVAPEDLAELIGAFNQVTAGLQATHATLTAEVRRLRGELHEANDRLARSRRLAALGEMAAGIAHEVRNPLGSIGLYAKMLSEDLEGRPEQQRTAGKIAAAVRGLDEIVGDVLTLARDSRLRITKTPVSDLFERAVDEGAGDRPGWLSVMTSETGGALAIDCDCGLVHQALVNLVRNAVEAVVVAGERPAAHVELIAEPATLGDGEDQPRRDAVSISVIDAGDGIPPEALDRMFNPFYTTRDTGTGLGLAIVHRIADAHGGAVEAVNNTGPGERGATVRLTLPVEIRESNEATTPHTIRGQVKEGRS